VIGNFQICNGNFQIDSITHSKQEENIKLNIKEENKTKQHRLNNGEQHENIKMNIKKKKSEQVPFLCHSIEQYFHAQIDSKVLFPEREEKDKCERINIMGET